MSGFNQPNLNLVAMDPRNVTITQCVLRRSDRAGLDPDKLATIVLSSKANFEHRYMQNKTASLSNEALAVSNYKSTVALDVINTSVLSRLRAYDLNSFFEQFPLVNVVNGWDPNQETIDLFENLDRLTDRDLQDEIYDTITWINTEVDEPEWKRELVWSREIILAACDVGLREAVLAKENEVLENKPGCTGGPVTFIVVMEMILSMSSDAFNELYRFIQRLDIKTYAGEDINDVVRDLRVNLRRLYACSSRGYIIPPTIVSDLIKVFQTTSCTNFNSVFAALSVQNLILQNSGSRSTKKGPTYKDILKIAEATFSEYKDEWVVSQGDANSGDPGQSGFNTSGQGKRKCHICGSEDHLKRNCPKNNGSNGQNGRGGGLNNRGNVDPRLQPPKPEDNRCTKVSNDPKRWDRRFEDGTVRSWCAKCVLRRDANGNRNTNKGRWTDGNARHYTDQHRGLSSRGNQNGGANRANLTTQGANDNAQPPSQEAGQNQSNQTGSNQNQDQNQNPQSSATVTFSEAISTQYGSRTGN